jgi:hypothetical protein
VANTDYGGRGKGTEGRMDALWQIEIGFLRMENSNRN